MKPSRRDFLAWVSLSALANCRRDDSARIVSTERTFRAPDGVQWQVAPLLGEAKRPWVIALHGRGECDRDLNTRARAWIQLYGLGEMHARLKQPPLTVSDVDGQLSAPDLEDINHQLAARPYRGIRVLGCSTPNVMVRPEGDLALEATLGEQAVGEMGLAKPGGLAGVSLGGRMALVVGMRRPDVFRFVSALQPAIQESEIPMLHVLCAKALATGARLQLVTSKDDPFRNAVEGLADSLERAGLTVYRRTTLGDHSYRWNRGPGSLALLHWHDRVQGDG